MRTLLATAFFLAACGGGTKATPVTPADDPPPGGRIAGPGEVVGDAALYAKVKASAIALPAGPPQMMCAGEGEATLGAQVAAWERQLGGPIAAQCEGAHCTIEVSSPIDPACDTNPDQDGCDGSSKIIEFDLNGAGEIVIDSLTCMAAG